MPTGFVYSPRFLQHEAGPQHPERPDRLRALIEKLEAMHLLPDLHAIDFTAADRRWIERLHTRAYVDRVYAACASGADYVDSPDAPINEHTAEVAQLAVGGVLAAVDAVLEGEVHNAFCAVRPPGHHAEAERSMGFCFFNNVAIAAEYLIAHHGLARVAIVDFDVHHGNGTQHLFEGRRDVLFVSLHEHPMHLYPGTGFVHETGRGEGEGYTLNLPLPPHSGDEEYRHTLREKALPKLEAFAPEFLLISAGFDAGRDDPLAHMDVTPRGFWWMTRELKELAERCCGGRLVSVLEGGYDLQCLAESAGLHVRTLMQPPGHDAMMAMKAGF